MIEPEYKRDMHKNYIILKQKNSEMTSEYGMKMVANNHIEGCLALELHYVDEKMECFYDITEKQPMSLLLQKQALEEQGLRNILTTIVATLKRSREYLLFEDSFVLEPEYIYMSLSGEEPQLMYYSGYEENMREQFIRFIEYLMDRVDYNDKAAVFLVYGIYKICREESCTLERLLEFLKKDGRLEQELERKELEEAQRLKEEEPFLDAMEEVESEEEKKKYPLWVWAACGVSVVVCLILVVAAAKTGMMYDLVTGKILVGKMAGFLGIMGALEAYGLLWILDEKHKVAYIAKRSDYVSPVEERRRTAKEAEWMENQWLSKTEMVKKEDGKKQEIQEWVTDKDIVKNEKLNREEFGKDDAGQATVVLAQRGEQYILKPEQKEQYMPIVILEFPFFVGTLKTKVDCVINSRSVSRFHAKLEQEGEKFYLVDLNSTNGTFINRERLQVNEKRELMLGDRISFADVTYQFCRES